MYYFKDEESNYFEETFRSFNLPKPTVNNVYDYDLYANGNRRYFFYKKVFTFAYEINLNVKGYYLFKPIKKVPKHIIEFLNSQKA